jgi:hypothetical protein
MSKGIFAVSACFFFVVYSSFEEGGGEQSSKLSRVRGGAQELGRSIGKGGSKTGSFGNKAIPFNVSRYNCDCVGERCDSSETRQDNLRCANVVLEMSREIGRVQILRSARLGLGLGLRRRSKISRGKEL